MVEDVRGEFLKNLQTADWLDNTTKKNAIEKLIAMKTSNGYPDELLQDEALERYYQSVMLNVDYSSYLNAIMSIKAFDKNTHFKTLREPTRNCYWIDLSNRVAKVNVGYNTRSNTIRVPAAFLQDIIYDENRPNYINYAVAGMIVGHEMTHGFDYHGRNFDKDGNLANWWSNETTLMFKRKSECIIEQYQQYIDPQLNMNMNGLLTLEENIADNGGLKKSFLAYTNWVKQNGPEKKLPGLNYTTSQMFWIAFAQSWCSYLKYGTALYRISNDKRASSRFRVIGTLSNIDDFANDFKCPIGSPMNPKKKCSVCLCLTSACVKTASRSIRYLNNKIDPCADFYSFACDKYLEQPTLPDEVLDRNTFSEVREVVSRQQYNIIMESKSNNLESRVSLIKLLTRCMERDGEINLEVENVKAILNSVGDWPILTGTKWNESNFDLLELTLSLKKIGIPYNFFFEFDVMVDPLKSYQNILEVKFRQPEMIISQKYKTIINIIRLFNNNSEVIEKNKRAYEEFFGFINKESNESLEAFTKLEVMMNITNNNWVRYVQRLIDNHNITIDKDEKILFIQKNIINFQSILLNTTKRMQANFYFFNIINWMYDYLPNMRYIDSHYVPKTSACVRVVAKSLPLLMNSLYIKRFFEVKTKTQIEKLVKEIRHEFLKILQNADWLDDNTRKNAIEKLVSMKTCIGYPDELLDNEVLQRYYQSLNVNYSTYLNAIMSINVFEKNNHFKRLREPVKNCYWIANSEIVSVVTAQYYIPGNSIRVPAAFLQELIFDENRPNYINYAIAGMVIGHEMTHGFDDIGGRFDKDGNFDNWWSNETSSTFQKKSECIINQYQQYIHPQLKANVNGLLTLGENIADNGGLKQSFLAYANWVKLHGTENKLPGLNYTTSQMFWIAFAQFWCSYDTNKSASNKLLYDVHAPARFRVIGTLSNIENFAADFKCPIGSPMNPKKKCKVCSCLTSVCVESAAKSLKYLNSKIDPCDDFYSFACDGLVNEQTLPDEVRSKNAFTALEEIVGKQHYDVINTSLSNKLSAQLHLKQFLVQCNSKNNTYNLEIDNINSILNSLGEWPMLMGKNGMKESEPENNPKYTTLKLLTNITGINWVPYVKRLFGMENVTINENEPIYLLHQLIRPCITFILKTSKRIQANFILIEIIKWMYAYLPSLNYVIEKRVKKTSECVYELAKRKVKIYENLCWLPDELLDDKGLEDYYQTLCINYTSFLNVIMSINVFETSNNLKRLRKKVHKCYWIDESKDVTTINALYSSLNNAIKLPAAFFQDMIFDRRRPSYMNYAIAGMVIGHEITHGFDNMGRMFDKNGNLRKWWSDETFEAFNKKTECIIKQYNNFKVPKLNSTVNGLLTLAENIADNGGLKQSFLAYNNWVKRNGNEKNVTRT
ncbi:hypothetical protein FQR65_LT17764 [Abscondita terminalis]|nr:hypothetical protein FQR65_LT17764 [Abscondita terminalis]